MSVTYNATVIGAPAPGQTDRNSSGTAVVANPGPTVITLGTVAAGQKWYFSDIEFQLDASTGLVQLLANARVLWQGVAGTAPIGCVRSRPLVANAGEVLTISFAAAAAGTPNGYYNLGAWSESA